MKAHFIFLSYCYLIFGEVEGLGGCSTLAPVGFGWIGEEIICIGCSTLAPVYFGWIGEEIICIAAYSHN